MADIWTTPQDNGDVVVQYVEDPMVVSTPVKVAARIRLELGFCGYHDHEIISLERASDRGSPGWRAMARVL